MSNARSLVVAMFVSALTLVVAANPLIASTTAARAVKIMKALGKTSVTIGASAVAGVVSAKVMKDFEHAHDDAPALHVIAYYALAGNRRIDEVQNFWVKPPDKHLSFMKTFEYLELRDLKELSKTNTDATVWVVLRGKQVNRAPLDWQGTVRLRWVGHNWLIMSMEIQPRRES